MKKIFTDIPHPIKEIARILYVEGFQCFLVGGAVRDSIMGITPHEYDITTDARPEDVQRIFKYTIPTGIKHGTILVIIEDMHVEITTFRSDGNYSDGRHPDHVKYASNIEEDLPRRDLTINAIAVNIKTGEIPSFCLGGIEDLNKKILREISEKNFTDDPLRLLRIFRFYSSLGFEPAENLIHIASKYSNLINKPAKERIEYELMKLFNGKYCAESLILMDKTGILEQLFPIVKELKQIPPNQHHHLDLFHHSIETVKQVQILYENSSEEVKSHMDRTDFGGFPRITHLKLACLLHDIGKPSTWTIEENTQRHRFIKHDSEGEKLCVPILKNLCFSNKQIEYISYIIKKHMYPSAVVSAPDMSEKTMMRYLRKSEDNAIDNILIAQADRLSALGPEITGEIVNNNINALNNLMDFCIETRKNIKPLPKLLDGNEIMQILNIKPSPRLGEILDTLKEAQISGDITTKEEAVNFIKTLK